MGLVIFALPAAAALTYLYWAAAEHRHELRLAVAAVVWATILCLFINWS
ncbi:hypothetical protein [Kitasatospora sp. NPDC001175]